MKNILSLILIFLTFNSFASFEDFKRTIQSEIVNGMFMANDEENSINYGNQGNEANPQGELDSQYWQRVGNYHFVMKKGVKPAEAIKAIFPTDGDGYTLLECHSMLIAIVYRSLMIAYGEERFNELFKTITIKYGDLKTSGLAELFTKKRILKNQIELGDWVYFQNHPDYLAKHPEGAWQGENAIYMGADDGQGYYSGFGAHELTEKEMIKELQLAYNAPQTDEDKRILKEEWDSLKLWLDKNSTYKKGKYFQLNADLFADLADDEDPNDFLDELFEPIALALGYSSIEYFSHEFNYGADEYDAGKYVFWVEKVKTYESQINQADIPGIVRIDRLDFKKLYQYK